MKASEKRKMFAIDGTHVVADGIRQAIDTYEEWTGATAKSVQVIDRSVIVAAGGKPATAAPNPVSIHHGEDGNPDGVHVATLDESFIASREYNGKWYTNLSGFGIEAAGATQPAPRQQADWDKPVPPLGQDEPTGDLPF